ncbi:hypothetical protein VNO77_30292 [Canavalia gladiata]|uniref:Uncharacterized protein n=1 Tax=Canavalia gladiata TaxID=3824 RepID=A0AAN9KNA4_CANGL
MFYSISSKVTATTLSLSLFTFSLSSFLGFSLCWAPSPAKPSTHSWVIIKSSLASNFNFPVLLLLYYLPLS